MRRETEKERARKKERYSDKYTRQTNNDHTNRYNTYREVE